MKPLALLIILLSLTGCGAARTGSKNVVEKYTETTTTNDGHMSTKSGQRTISESSNSQTTIDLMPPKEIGGMLGLITGINWKDMLLTFVTTWAAYQTASARKNGERAEYHAASEDELWNMHKESIKE